MIRLVASKSIAGYPKCGSVESKSDVGETGLGRVALYAMLNVAATENAPPVGGKSDRQVNRGNRYAVPVTVSQVVEEAARVLGCHVDAEFAQRGFFRA